jgi:hypothetical protein
MGGLAEGQQVDDVGRRQRWIGAVLCAQLIGRSAKVQIDFVFLDVRSQSHVQNWLRLRRIYKLDGAARENIAVPAQNHVAAAQIDAAENYGFGGGSANLKVSVPIDAH